MLLWASFGDLWALGHKVDFDGPNRRIIVAPGVSSIDVKADIYSSWKEWLQLYDNAKYLPAIRTIGGDPLGGGVFAGDLYFLQNNWRVQVSELVNVTGALFSDDGGSPYVIGEGGGVISTVSNLTQTALSTQNVVTGDLSTVPTTAEIVAEVLAALNATSIPVNTIQIRGQTITGTGTAENPWGP